MAIKTAKIITFTSVKGGTGKTTTVLNIAGLLNKKNLKVLIADFDFYGGVIASSLNLEYKNDVYTFVNDLMNNKFETVDDYVTSFTENIDILPAPRDPRSASKINAKYIEIIINRLKPKYDVILIDTNHIASSVNLITMDMSDNFYYIITNTLADLKNMKSMVSIFKDMNEEDYRIVLNNSITNIKTIYSDYDIKNMIKSEINFTIPKSLYEKNIEKYVYDGKIITMNGSSKYEVYENIINDFLKN